jgi:hypothetical protein
MLHQIRHERDEWLHKALSLSCSSKEQDMLRRAIGPLTRLVDFD